MDAIAKTISDAVRNSLNNAADDDYIDGDGYRCCAKCKKRKEFDAPHPFGGKKIRVGIPCDCKRAEMEAKKRQEEADRFKQRMDALKRDGITDPSYLRCTFELDDSPGSQISSVCRKYVSNWTEMRDRNTGILFYGSVGTGKSFYACCIANALLKDLVPVSVTNLSRVLNQLSGFDGRQDVIDKLQKYDLLVIDDLGIERGSGYALEQIFNIFDSRMRAGKPLIVTTNLSKTELKNPGDIEHQRIYDRVLSMCPIQLKMDGTSRRIQISSTRAENARRVMR